MGKRLTHDDFLIRSNNIFGDKYTYLSEYKDSRLDVDVLCND